MQRVREKALEDVVMMNLDSNTLETPFDDVQALPPDVVSVTGSPASCHIRLARLCTCLLSAAPLSPRCLY